MTKIVAQIQRLSLHLSGTQIKLQYYRNMMRNICERKVGYGECYNVLQNFDLERSSNSPDYTEGMPDPVHRHYLLII